MKKAIWTIVIILVIVVAAVFGSSIFMLHYSLDPDPCRADTAVCYQRLFNTYPETRPWVDSLRAANALRDTFVIMPTGERHHALCVNRGSQKTALIIHGWRDCSIDFLFLARLYEHELGYNIVMPDLHAHGLSEGDMIQMGWFDRKDALHWLTVFQTDTMVVHGVSMGGATTMMTSAEPLSPGIRDIHFIDDCGYTSVWDEFSGEIQNQFGLPPFPLMYTTNLLCKLWLDWSFNEASALDAVRRSPHPMLFIHGSADTFVPTEMVHRLYAAKPSKKTLWIAPDARHAESYLMHKDEYLHRLRDFLSNKEPRTK